MKTTTSYLFIIGIAGGLLSGFFSDRLVKKRGLKFGRRIVGVTCLGVMGILFFIAASTPNNTLVAATLMCGYFFMPAHGINAFSTCIDIGKSKTCTVAGIMNFAGNMGAFFLAVLFGKIVDVTHSFNAPLFVVAGVLFIGSMMWFAVDPTKELDTAESGIDRITAGVELKFIA